MVLLPLTRSVSPMQLVPQSLPSTTLAPGDPLPGLGVIDRVGVLDRRPGVRGDGGDRGLDLRVRPQRHRHLRAGADRSTGGVGWSGRSDRTVASASETSRLAPRGDAHEPFRSRCATITGAAAVVLTVASSMFSPRTPE